jgi:cell division septation protein DedD
MNKTGTIFCCLLASIMLSTVSRGGEPESKSGTAMDLGESESGLEKETWAKVEKASPGPKAAAELKEYLRLFPHGPHACQAFLIQGRGQENLLEARQDFQTATSCPGPCAAEGGLELGKLEYSLGRYSQAEDALTGALAVSATPCVDLFFWRGQARRMSGKFKDSLGDFRACQDRPASGDLKSLAVLGEADCEAALGDTGAAVKAYASLADSSVAAQALWATAALEEAVGEKEEAGDKLRLLARDFPATFEGGKALQRLKAQPPLAPVKERLREVPAAPGVQAGDAPGYWVQVGSYASGNWADKLVQALKKKKYPVSKRVVRIKGHAFHEVRIGRFATRASALAAGKKIAKKEGLPFVVKPLE